MNYFSLYKNNERIAQVGIIGANGGFGYSFLAQIPLMRNSLALRAICDLDAEESLALLCTLGYDERRYHVCRTHADIDQALKKDDAIIILEDGNLLTECGIDILVEATGSPEISSMMAERCLKTGIHVCMVSKEADCVSGPYLYKLAQEKGLVYSIAGGDQPANLISLLSWVKTLGLDVIAAGKSSEYDFVYDLKSGTFNFQEESALLPELAEHWELKGMQTLKERSRVLAAFPQFAVPDYCEMNVVCNATDLVPSSNHFHYPVCRVDELAEIYIPVEDGGVLTKTGVVDVFNNLRRPDEASFAGGVFVIVRCHDQRVWKLLETKGHIVSKNGKYACMYLPYHFMGVEAPISVVNAHRLALSSYDRLKHRAIMVTRTERDFKKGEKMDLVTHHRLLQDVTTTLEEVDGTTKDIAPYYLVAGNRLACDVSKGTVITMDMLELKESNLSRMYKAGLTDGQ